jgi:orotidine-5'-phosphate decarboxylase
MSITVLQQKIREKKTPVALGLSPNFEKISPKIAGRFRQMYCDSVQTYTESIRYHCGELIEKTAELLPAVVLDAAAFLRYGSVGLEVLENLVSAARAHGMYTIVDARTTCPDNWLGGYVGADGVTALPYLGSDGYHTDKEDKAIFVVLRTANASAFEVQELMAGDRKLYAAVAERVSRQGEALGAAVGSDFPLDVKELRRKMGKTFLLLTDTTPRTAAYAFDDFGHGALVVNGAIEQAEDPEAAAREAIAEMKKTVIVA